MAERAASPAGEARHLHACLFRGPLDEVTAARYEAALREMGAGRSRLVATVVARRLDAEAVEFALRRRRKGSELARRMQVLCYLAEARPGNLGEFVNLKSSRWRAWCALLAATLRSVWKLVKGEYLVRRHELI